MVVTKKIFNPYQDPSLFNLVLSVSRWALILSSVFMYPAIGTGAIFDKLYQFMPIYGYRHLFGCWCCWEHLSIGRDALLMHRFVRIKHAGHIHSLYGKEANEHYNITIKLLYCSRYLLTNHWTMNIWMTYTKQIYLGVLFSFGALPLRKIAQL